MNDITLEEVSLTPPHGLMELLEALGDGENGFSGTAVASGELPLKDYLSACCSSAERREHKEHLIPQTVFWVLNGNGRAVGMVKVRHWLNEITSVNGGHIGFYIHPDFRGKGYCKQALALALIELKKLGESEALITVYPENSASIRVVESNGGIFQDTIFDKRSGHYVNRYVIELGPPEESPCGKHAK